MHLTDTVAGCDDRIAGDAQDEKGRACIGVALIAGPEGERGHTAPGHGLRIRGCLGDHHVGQWALDRHPDFLDRRQAVGIGCGCHNEKIARLQSVDGHFQPLDRHRRERWRRNGCAEGQRVTVRVGKARDEGDGLADIDGL